MNQRNNLWPITKLIRVHKIEFPTPIILNPATEKFATWRD